MGLDSIEKKVADHYNKGHPAGQQQQAAPPSAPAPAPAPAQQQASPPEKEHHNHAGNAAKGFGHAAIFGAGATAGADAVKSLLGQ